MIKPSKEQIFGLAAYARARISGDDAQLEYICNQIGAWALEQAALIAQECETGVGAAFRIRSATPSEQKE